MQHGFTLDEAFSLPEERLTAFYISIVENNNPVKFDFNRWDWVKINEKV